MTLDSHQTFEIGKLLLLEYKDGNFHINQHRELIYLNERFESSQGQKRKKKKEKRKTPKESKMVRETNTQI